MLEIIFFAVIAYFIFKKLFSALGDTKYDLEGKRSESKTFENLRNNFASFMEKRPQHNTPEIDIASGLEAGLSESERKIFDQIRKYEPGFIAESFIKKAKLAFKVIIESFAQDNKLSLKELCNKDIYEDFIVQIDNREKQNQTLDLTIVSVKEAVIKSVSQIDLEAFIKVEIISEQIKAIRDKVSGEIISGNPTKVVKVKDSWTFVRKINAPTKVWRLASIDENEK